MIPLLYMGLGVFGDREGTLRSIPDYAGISRLLSSLVQRVDVLETKLNHFLNWNTDPYLGFRSDRSLCRQPSRLSEYGCKSGNCPGLYDATVCLDNIMPGNCIVYDYGIREQPEFGQVLANPPFNCSVYAFDPSPVTEEPIKLLDGRYGPYVTDGATNASLPRGTTVEELDFDQAVNLLAERAARSPKKATRKKKKAKKKAAKKKTAKKKKTKKKAAKKKKTPS